MLPPTAAAASMAARQLVLARAATPASASALLLRVASAQQQLRGYATPSGPPPKGFRMRPPTEWHEEKEGTLTKVGKYFLLTEMARGMYVLMEQFFRPP